MINVTMGEGRQLLHDSERFAVHLPLRGAGKAKGTLLELAARRRRGRIQQCWPASAWGVTPPPGCANLRLSFAPSLVYTDACRGAPTMVAVRGPILRRVDDHRTEPQMPPCSQPGRT
jgi:hypothetical protein